MLEIPLLSLFVFPPISFPPFSPPSLLPCLSFSPITLHLFLSSFLSFFFPLLLPSFLSSLFPFTYLRGGDLTSPSVRCGSTHSSLGFSASAYGLSSRAPPSLQPVCSRRASSLSRPGRGGREGSRYRTGSPSSLTPFLGKTLGESKPPNGGEGESFSSAPVL